MRSRWVVALACVVLEGTVAGCIASRPSDRVAPTTAGRARNVILFVGDAGGLPTISAASLYGHDRPQALFIQSMPHLALMETSAADAWVTDSAAAMTAMVTGRKTRRGVISQSETAIRQQKDGERLKTILEYAEDHGLSTGVISNDSMAGATPAACYAHANDRKSTGEIVAQIVTPASGDGVDLVLGGGRQEIYAAVAARALDLDAALRAKGYQVLDSPDAFSADASRAVALTDADDFDLSSVVERAVTSLSRNPKGYFLMVEWDLHTDVPKVGLDHALVLDRVIREVAGRVGRDTLVMFAADHSFDIRVRNGRQGRPLIVDVPAGEKPPDDAPLRVDDGHTGEEVVVTALGPGAERVRGFIANTDLFRIMMAAFGWAGSPDSR
jgi:alkaline phosphatase